MNNQKIVKVSSDARTIEVGVNGVEVIRFYKHEKGGTAGPFDIYESLDKDGKLIDRKGFFEQDNITVEYHDEDNIANNAKQGMAEIIKYHGLFGDSIKKPENAFEREMTLFDFIN